MSDIPVFNPTGPVTTVYQNGIPMLEQDGERFTFSEYDKRDGRWTSNPVWIPHGQRSIIELKEVVDKLIAKLRDVESAVISAQLTFKNHFATVEPAGGMMTPYYVDRAEPWIQGTPIQGFPISVDHISSPEKFNQYPPAPVEAPHLYPDEQKKTPPPVKRRKRSPNKKKIPPAT